MNESLYTDMSKVYLESIAPADPRPQILKERILEAKKHLDPVGQEDGDIDNDGDSDENDRYLRRRREAIGKAIGTNKIKEEFIFEPIERYNWRSTVGEDIQGAIDGLKADKQIEVKPVDNYTKGANGKRVVTINPTITDLKEQVDEMGGELISEMDIDDLSAIAAEYFIERGLNEDGIRIVIEQLGDEEFCDWVLDIADETVLMEARAAKKRTGGKSYEQIKAEIDAREAAKKKTPAATRAKKEIDRKAAVKTATVTQKTKSRPPGQERMIRGTQQALKKATSPETTRAATRSVADALARTALSAWEGHKSAMQAKKEGKGLGKQLASGAGATLGSFFKKGTAHFKEYVEYLMSEGYDLSEITLQDLYEEFEQLQEKASSEQQQKLFGLALSVKRGDTPRSEASEEVLKIVDSMSEKKIRDFAKTKHKNIPRKVEEGVTYETIINILKR